MTRPTLITIIGKSAKDPRDPVPEKALRMAEEVGRLIAERKGIVVTGGLSGVMEAVSRGAKSAGGLVIGILPGFDKRDANEFVDIAVTTGMGWMRNTLVRPTVRKPNPRVTMKSRKPLRARSALAQNTTVPVSANTMTRIGLYDRSSMVVS